MCPVPFFRGIGVLDLLLREIGYGLSFCPETRPVVHDSSLSLKIRRGPLSANPASSTLFLPSFLADRRFAKAPPSFSSQNNDSLFSGLTSSFPSNLEMVLPFPFFVEEDNIGSSLSHRTPLFKLMPLFSLKEEFRRLFP